MILKHLIHFFLISLFSSHSMASKECGMYLTSNYKFLVHGRLITVSLNDLIYDVHGLLGQSHVMDIHLSAFHGQLPAYFKDEKLTQMSFESDNKNLKFTGRLIEVSDNEFVVEIFKVWRADPFFYD